MAGLMVSTMASRVRGSRFNPRGGSTFMELTQLLEEKIGKLQLVLNSGDGNFYVLTISD